MQNFKRNPRHLKKSKENYSLTFQAVCTVLPATAYQADNLITVRNLSLSLSLSKLCFTHSSASWHALRRGQEQMRKSLVLSPLNLSHQQVWALVWERFKLPQRLRAKAQTTHLSSSAHLFLPATLLHVYLLLSLKRL